MRMLAARATFVSTLALIGMLTATGVAAALSTGNGGWAWQNPLPHATGYQGAFFTTATHGWLVTDDCILRTTDGGATVRVRATHNVRLRDITFVGSRHGWAVGSPVTSGRVIIYRTTNGGSTWTRVPVDQKGWLNAVAFANRNVGWAVGQRPSSDGGRGLILKTVNGGRTWFAQKSSAVMGINDVHVMSAARAWVVGDDGRARRTTNGGAKWKAITRDLHQWLVAIDFESPLVGWLAGGRKVWHTRDGGVTWTVQLDFTIDEGAINDLAFGDQTNGWLARDSGDVYATTDGGATWAPKSAPTFVGLNRVCAVSPQAAVVAGAGGRLGRSLDNGATWAWLPQGAGGHDGRCTGVDFIDANTGWVAVGSKPIRALPASAAVLHTADGGATWTAQDPGTTSPLLAVDFVDASNGWAVGAGGVIVHTTNGGATWAPQPSGTTADLSAVRFIDAQNGWAVGGNRSPLSLDPPGGAVVRHTADGGATWTAQTSPDFTYNALYGVDFADGQHGWAVGWEETDYGDAAIVFATTDGGATWARQLRFIPPVSHSVGHAALWSVVALDARRVVAVGYSDDNDIRLPLVYRTTNGGAEWKSAVVPRAWPDRLTAGFSDVAFCGATMAWAVGPSGISARSRDGGKTWTKQRSGVSGDLNGVCFVTATRGWAIGDHAAILRTSTGGLAP